MVFLLLLSKSFMVDPEGLLFFLILQALVVVVPFPSKLVGRLHGGWVVVLLSDGNERVSAILTISIVSMLAKVGSVLESIMVELIHSRQFAVGMVGLQGWLQERSVVEHGCMGIGVFQGKCATVSVTEMDIGVVGVVVV